MSTLALKYNFIIPQAALYTDSSLTYFPYAILKMKV